MSSTTALPFITHCEDTEQLVNYTPSNVSGYTKAMETRCEVLTTLQLKTHVFWDVTPSKLVNNYRLFGRP